MLGSARFDNPEQARQLFEEPGYFETFKDNFDKTQSMNRWIDTTLAKYVKNRMGTESDEVRKLAEDNITHANIDQWIPETIDEKRKLAGMPSQNIGTSDAAQ
jgi:hypothetical protein